MLKVLACGRIGGMIAQAGVGEWLEECQAGPGWTPDTVRADGHCSLCFLDNQLVRMCLLHYQPAGDNQFKCPLRKAAFPSHTGTQFGQTGRSGSAAITQVSRAGGREFETG